MNEDAKTIMLFNLLGHKQGTNYAYSVYDKKGIAPAIMTMTGGGRQPMIVEVEHEQDE